MADSTRIGRSAFTRLSTLHVVHAFVTDDGIADRDRAAVEARGIEVLVAR